MPPGENCYMLTLPLQTDLPSSFDVSFGLYIDGGLADWNVYERPGYAQIGYVNYQIPKASGTYYNALQNTVGCFRTPSLAEGDLTLSFKAMAYQNPGGRRTQRDILAESFRDSWGERLGCSICAYRLLG